MQPPGSGGSWDTASDQSSRLPSPPLPLRQPTSCSGVHTEEEEGEPVWPLGCWGRRAGAQPGFAPCCPELAAGAVPVPVEALQGRC